VSAVVERMSHALAELDKRWAGKRRPKAFYLVADDWRDFMATNPPTIQTMFGNNPPTLVTDPAFRETPVRESTGKVSRLYDSTTTGREI
jgi:hypothetical protein